MQEVSEPAAGRRPAQQFAGVDLRRPKGYAAPPPAASTEGDPCPRCESRDTKFCYYNNYNTAQPRHFCKGCRRYWTKGGTLRNVPVGGGTRKKPSSSTSYAAAAKPKRPYKKKRRVAPPEPTAPAPVAAVVDSAKTTPTTATADSDKTTTTTLTTDAGREITDAASEITTELVVPAAAAEDDDSLVHLLQPDADAVALGLGLPDFPCSGKSALLEPDSFEWPPSFDLGACWGEPDPALFLNLP